MAILENRYKIGKAAVKFGWVPVKSVSSRMIFCKGTRTISVNFRLDADDEIVSAFDGTTAIKGQDMTAAVVAALRKG